MTDEISYSQDDSQEKDHFIFTLLCKRNDAEFERSNILDSKASGIIGFAGLIIGLFGTLISFLLGEMSQNTHFMFYYQSYRVFLFMGILSLAVSILSCIFAYTVKTYVIIPKPTALIEKYAKN